ncbi:hypothetical protein [Streptomyces sp. CMB-StM0423]|uniref:hypothetical protein n=1 Tax=Streptomyces sp. CMB-StM0423 TaxID=2059884 RepID=UPI00131AE605|nr:hypothetical protein [Streptomyces sp. CMB-StM0423]
MVVAYCMAAVAAAGTAAFVAVVAGAPAGLVLAAEWAAAVPAVMLAAGVAGLNRPAGR